MNAHRVGPRKVPVKQCHLFTRALLPFIVACAYLDISFVPPKPPVTYLDAPSVS